VLSAAAAQYDGVVERSRLDRDVEGARAGLWVSNMPGAEMQHLPEPELFRGVRRRGLRACVFIIIVAVALAVVVKPGFMGVVLILSAGTLACLAVTYWVPRRVRRLIDAARLKRWRVCPRCGYSLAELNEEGRCPECGEPYTHATLQGQWQRWSRQAW